MEERVQRTRRRGAADGYSADWRDSAACRDVDPEAFHPDGTPGPGNSLEDMEQKAARYCKEACPLWVREACLAYAVEAQEPSGTWGGTTTKDRDEMKRARRANARRTA